MLAAVFLVVFLGGPLVFRVMTRTAVSRLGTQTLALLVVGFALAGLGLRYGSSTQWGQDVQVTVLGIVLIWLSWIGVLAFGAQMMRQADPGIAMRRWSGVIGALGTTVPWFGMASASLLGA